MDGVAPAGGAGGGPPRLTWPALHGPPVWLLQGTQTRLLYFELLPYIKRNPGEYLETWKHRGKTAPVRIHGPAGRTDAPSVPSADVLSVTRVSVVGSSGPALALRVRASVPTEEGDAGRRVLCVAERGVALTRGRPACSKRPRKGRAVGMLFVALKDTLS